MATKETSNTNNTNNNSNNNNNNKEEYQEIGDNDFKDYERLEKINKVFNERQRDRYSKSNKGIENVTNKSSNNTKVNFQRIKGIIHSVLGDKIPISDDIQKILNSVAKIHAGEIIEEAKLVQLEEENINNSLNLKEIDLKDKALKPRHLREARRRMMSKGLVPNFINPDPLEDF